MRLFSKLKWWLYDDVVQVRAFIEETYGFDVGWDDKNRSILVNDQPITKCFFRLYSNGHNDGYSRDIKKALKIAGFSV